MEQYKICKSINDSTVSKIVARKWIEVSDLLNGQYCINKYIRFKIRMVGFDFRDYIDAYIVVKRIIDL